MSKINMEDKDMKKTYIVPNMRVIETKLETMIAASLQIKGGTDQESDLLSRDRGDWDDDE